MVTKKYPKFCGIFEFEEISHLGRFLIHPCIVHAIKKQIRERDRLKSLAFRHKSENYWNAYTTSRNRVTDVLRETKAAYYKGEFERVKHDPKHASMENFE